MKNPVLWILSCSSVEVSWKSEKRNNQMQRALFYTKHTDKFYYKETNNNKIFTSPKPNLFVLQVKTNGARDYGLLRGQRHSFRHLQHVCSSHSAVLINLSGRYSSKLSFLLFFLYSWNMFFCPLSTILKAMFSEQAAFSRPENL